MWFFMLAVDLLIPIAMVGCGVCFIKRPPKQVSAILGYRTALSMKNNDTWRFAHNYCGKLWLTLGLVLLPLSAVPFAFIFGRGSAIPAIVGGAVCLTQSFSLVVTFLLTERALRKFFDENGLKRQ